MGRKLDGFRDAVGSQWRRMGAGFKQWNQNRKKSRFPAPKEDPPHSGAPLSLDERLDQSFDTMIQEVDQLDHEKYSLEEHAEYAWIVMVRMILPLIFFLVLGYEDGLFMTGFHEFAWVAFVAIMYFIGYGLEALRVAMVYSMGFSKGGGREKAYRAQFLIWLLMSLGCGVAQLASALVIQALGGDQAVTGDNAVAQGAKVVLAHMPWLVYLAIVLRVVLCAVADWACSGFLHRKKKNVEQKVASITTRATNISTVLQANQNARSIIDNARQYQKMMDSQREELEALRVQQRAVFDLAFSAGMRQMRRNTGTEGSESEDPYGAGNE